MGRLYHTGGHVAVLVMESMEQPNAHALGCSVQNVALHLYSFKNAAFDNL